MLTHGFDAYRVYLSAPGDLDAEKDACRAAIADSNAADAMPRGILLVTVGLPQEGVIEQYRSAVAENIRQCSYYVQIFEDDWGPRNLSRKMFHLACDRRSGGAEPPMREVVVFLKHAPRETDPEILAFRRELTEMSGIRVFTFAALEELKAQLREVATGWIADIQRGQQTAAAAAEA